MLTLNDGRAELWQWDTGRTLSVDADCSQVHFSNKVFGRSIDVDVVDGAAVIPDVLLQTDKDLNVWAFVGTADNGYTKISKTFTVNRRNKPSDYVFTPTDQMTLQTIQSQIGDLADLTTEAKENLVAAINEAAASGGSGSMDLRVADGYIQYSTDGGRTWTNLIAMADLKGADGAPGKDGADGQPGADGVGIQSVVQTTTSTDDGGTNIVTVTKTDGTSSTFSVKNGSKGSNGQAGASGADGKSAYQYAVDGGYTGTETEFAEKMASGALIVHVTGVNDNLSADKTYVDIRDAILAGTTVLVDRGEFYLPLVSINTEYQSLLFGTTTCVNDDTGKMVYESLIEITQNDEVKDIGALVDIPTTLPNPNALTFTGAVTGSYDGSAPLSVEIPSGGGGGGIGTGSYEFSVLASGTIPANTITAAEIGNGMIDTGITLGMLRQYKIFNMLYRCDSGKQYYAFTVGNPGQPLYTHKRFYYATSNAMNATILWLDSARTAVLMLGSTGNSRVIPPADVENMGSFLDSGLCSRDAAMSAINAYGNLADISDEAKIYVGVMQMNGQATNTKDFTWAICGVVK